MSCGFELYLLYPASFHFAGAFLFCTASFVYGIIKRHEGVVQSMPLGMVFTLLGFWDATIPMYPIGH